MRNRLYILLLIASFCSCKKGPDTGSMNPSGSLPEVYTLPASAPFASFAICGGTVGRDGGSTVTTRGLCWSTAHNPTLADSHLNLGSGTGSFQGAITGITPGVLYYIRAFATNSTGTAYGNESSAMSPDLNILVAGVEKDASGTDLGRLWLNGYPSTSYFGAIYRSVCVSSAGDIYVAGNFGPWAVYWKNNNRIDLTQPFNTSESWAIAVSGNDIYIAGSERNTVTGFFEAKYWKNGVATRISDGSRNAYAKAIYVNGTDIYIGWIENSGTNMAKIWRNGTFTNLTGGMTNADIRSVFVSGSDVYAAGSEENLNGHFVAKYWKNGIATSLTDGSANCLATGIVVAGPDVYVSGAQNTEQAKFWKNGVLTNLTGIVPNGYAGSVFVLGTDVFVGGSSGNFAMIWKNGDPYQITDGTTAAVANSILVTH